MTHPLITVLNNIKQTSDKPFVTIKEVERQLGHSVSFGLMTKVLPESDYKYCTQVVSGHGFKAEFRAKYNEEAKVNIPLINFGPGGFESYEVGGGCAHCIAI